jgi:hypothetical protein
MRASSGEPVRRAAALLDAASTDVAPLLAAYELSLDAFHGPTPSTLIDDAIAIAADLTAYHAVDDDDRDAGLSLFLELDAMVSAIVAAERTGRLPHGTADTLASRLDQALAGMSYRAPHLAQLAENRWLGRRRPGPRGGVWLARRAHGGGAFTSADRRCRQGRDGPRAPHRRRHGDPLARTACRPCATLLQQVAANRHRTARQPARFATASVSVPKQTSLVEDDDFSVFLEESGAELVLRYLAEAYLRRGDASTAMELLLRARTTVSAKVKGFERIVLLSSTPMESRLRQEGSLASVREPALEFGMLLDDWKPDFIRWPRDHDNDDAWIAALEDARSRLPY